MASRTRRGVTSRRGVEGAGASAEASSKRRTCTRAVVRRRGASNAHRRAGRAVAGSLGSTTSDAASPTVGASREEREREYLLRMGGLEEDADFL
jgi:hypothetical protein